ncbi:VOC family protein [Rheinheimera salexigens]|uniref:Lactoylglutathione lyase n=1 Tax=Rheinheimera salexigens TaxID=1628148 RepID=A0A1E7Q375_9GAMM|nr:VOC family protein [Rheinheimera salexigens]OEY68560.1 lactoylglutathione lyase [Rheinheimera salexigens]
MLKIIALDHVVFRTTKLEAMLQFYCDVLGCTVERDKLDDNGLIQLRAGSALIDLVQVDSKLGQLGGKAPEQDGRNVDHVCLQVAAISQDNLKQYLAQHQIKHSEFALRYGAAGLTESIYIADPEQNVIELKPLID